MFAHAGAALAEVSAGSTVTFIPFALADWDDYAERAGNAFGALGIELRSAHRHDDPGRWKHRWDRVAGGDRRAGRDRDAGRTARGRP